MIRILSTLLIVASFSLASTAQGQSPVKTGAKGGLNFATFGGSDDQYDTRNGFVIGGFAKFSLPDSPFAIQPEALYSQKGAVSNGNEIRMNYFEVPVLLKYSLAPGQSVQPNLFGGPYAAMRLIAEQEGGTGGLFGGGSNIENQTESVDYGFTAGGGIDIEVGSSIFTVDARYSWGLADVFRERSGNNRAFSVTIGISLPDL